MKHLPIILISSFLVLINPALIKSLELTPGYPLFEFNCSKTGNYTPNSFYQYSLFNLLSNLSSQASINGGFYYNTIGQGSSQVYASYLCRGDVPLHTCGQCVHNATQTVVSKCPSQTGAAIWYIECMFQYSNAPFWGLVEDRFRLLLWNRQNMTAAQAPGFAKVLANALGDLATLTPNQVVPVKMFATKEAELAGSGGKKLYTLAQCRPDLSRRVCEDCLKECIGNVSTGKMGGMVVFPSCNIRFEVYRFYNQATALAPRSGTFVRARRKPSIIYIVIIPAAVVTCLIFGIWVYLYKKKVKITSNAARDLQEITTTESIQFAFNKIRASTNNFSHDRKLGQGGFGAVYKGLLENGQEIAVKRLSKNSGQGIREFKNEVLLVAKLQHRNLVKLLGFCLSGKEKALVYEFLPNSSLDKFLSDSSMKKSLDWKTRFKIICGIAKGLLYLHDDSRLKIIHRDLKSSNILLDKAMNPKISDFGLARLFEVDQTQAETNRIVGTYGYMAPEYAMTGHFSIKSDVYSFGVIILEIVSGQRNRFFNRPQIEEALLLRAWKLWSEGTALDLVDPSLGDDYSNEEVSKCIHMALLCIQEDPIKRPNMSLVVSSLNGQSIAFPQPVAPNFCHSSACTTSSSNSHNMQHDVQVNISGTENITDICPR